MGAGWLSRRSATGLNVQLGHTGLEPDPADWILFVVTAAIMNLPDHVGIGLMIRS